MITLNSRVRISDSTNSLTIAESFVGKEGIVTEVYPPDANYEDAYQVTLPDGRHDMFYPDELEVLP